MRHLVRRLVKLHVTRAGDDQRHDASVDLLLDGAAE